MGWARFDDEYPRHGKIQSIPPAVRADAMALELAALCYSARVLSDGHISRAVTHSLALEVGFERRENVDSRRLNGAISALVEVGRWRANGAGGYVVHDYSEYQPTSSEVKERRAKETDKKRKQRAQQRLSLETSPGDKGDVSPALSPGDASRVGATGAGAPTRPGPSQTHREKTTSPAAVDPSTSPSTNSLDAAQDPEPEEPEEAAAAGEADDLAAAIQALRGFDERSWTSIGPLVEAIGAPEAASVLAEVKRRRNVENPVGLLKQLLEIKHRELVRAQVESSIAETPKPKLEQLHDDPEAYVRELGWKLPDDVLDSALEQLLPNDQGRRFELANLAADIRREQGAAA